MEEVLSKIKEFRKKKGYSYETMAHELDTSPAAYRKIELN
jgi:DNA-binding XRE family transcriptional regulator